MEQTKEKRLQTVKTLFENIRSVTTAHGKFLASEREYLGGDKLYMREAHFVIAIGIGEPPTMSELAEKLDVTAGAVSQLTQRMEDKGYVKRFRLQDDKRKSIVVLTDKGEKLYHEHQAYDNDKYLQITEMLSKYSDEELQLFIQFEQKISNMFCEYIQSF